MLLVVDAANVVGSRPDGWWRDRAGAAARLAARIDALLATDPGALAAAVDAGAPADVVLVLEGAARAAEVEPASAALTVLRADRDGDTAIAELTAERAAAGEDVVVVTADRGLRERVRAAGGRSTGPSTLLHLLDPPAR